MPSEDTKILEFKDPLKTVYRKTTIFQSKENND